VAVRPQSIKVRVAEVVPVTPLVKRFRFVPIAGGLLPAFSGGAHTIVEMHDGAVVRRNPYSLMGSPDELDSYQVSVRKVEDSRGGSVFMHDRVKAGDEMAVSPPVNLFALAWDARKHLLLAGGIGITPFISQMIQLDRAEMPFELHFCIRNDDRGPYWRDLQQRYSRRVQVHRAESGLGMDVEALLAMQPLGTHLFVCGPGPMIEGVYATARGLGWPEENLHSERFQAPATGAAFDVVLRHSGKRIHVGTHESLLEAIEAADVEAPYLCRGGACGQCETGVLACDGRLIHNDHYLSAEERASGRKIMPCVSRFEGRELVLDL
jgi:ferredoxin-NADP reductase